MANIGAGMLIYELQKKIQQIQLELDELGSTSEIPELITSANLLRANEFLTKSNEKKTQLVEAYAQYSHALKDLLSSVFEIQHDLKEILKEQSSMISKKDSKRKSKKVTSVLDELRLLQ